MDDTTRSPHDRQRSVITRSSRRAHFYLLSTTSRREPGESRASTPRSAPGHDPDLKAGRPGLADLPALTTATRFPMDMARPDHAAPWMLERALRERLGPLRGDTHMRVARRRHDLAAAAVFRVQPPDGRWIVEAIAARDPEDGAAIDTALRAGVQGAGAAGARRVIAHLPGDMTVDHALRRSGFVPFVTESVYMLNSEHHDANPAPDVRRVHPADVWGIHQLYLDIVPRQVQYAEAVTSRSWERSRPLRPGVRRSSGWVIEDHGRIRGYARVSTEHDPRVARIDVLIDPYLRARAPHLIRAAAAEACHLHGVPCVAVIPGYAQELHTPLQNNGFIHVGDQAGWVCYTTVPARSYIVAVDLGAPATTETQRVRVPGLSGAGMSAAGESGRGGAHLTLVSSTPDMETL